MLRSVTAPVIRRCPFQIGIVSTGLIVQDTANSRVLLECRVGTLVLDEAHRARRSRGITASGDANRLMEFMLRAAPKARHVILGTATPVQTDVEEFGTCSRYSTTAPTMVLGRSASYWRRPPIAVPVLTGEKVIADEQEAWHWLRNPLPVKREDGLFDLIRLDLGLKPDRFYTDKPVAPRASVSSSAIILSCATRYFANAPHSNILGCWTASPSTSGPVKMNACQCSMVLPALHLPSST